MINYNISMSTKIDYRIKKVLISELQIKKGCKKAAIWVNKTYANLKKPLIIVAILRGAVLFFGELLKNISIDVETDFIAFSSYNGKTSQQFKPKLITDIRFNIKDRDVLIVEDVIDTGSTIFEAIQLFKKRKPKSIKVISLIKKKLNVLTFKPNYSCFTVGKEFIVGFGLDYQQIFRNLPYIGILKDKYIKN